MFFVVFLSLLTTSFLPHDTIHETVSTNAPMIHSSGLFTYGAHTNTFHLRYAYLKAEQIEKNWAWWCTLRGYADTHIPETNYGYILPNLSLYDYGIEVQSDGWFLSFRGAAIPRWNTQGFLLVPFSVRRDNPGEFEASSWYLEEPVNASGIRLGWKSEWGYFSYSQGDYRHLIPMGITAHLFLPWVEWRNTLILYNGEPETYSLKDYHYQIQSSASSALDLSCVRLFLLGEVTYQQRTNRIGVRLEQALRYGNVQVGLRQIWWNTMGWNLEGGVLFWLGDDRFAIGLQASLDHHGYFGARVDF